MNSLLVRIAPRFFKPTLAHHKRSIRLMALERLDLNDPAQQQEALAWLQKETDASLLEKALPQFPDLQPLIELLHDQQRLSAELEKTLVAFLGQQLSRWTQLQEEQQQLLNSLRHPQLLRQLIQEAKALEVRQAALQQLDTEEELWLEIALSNSLAKIRQEAAQAIVSEAALETLVKEATGDKRVQRLARDKLNALKAKEQELQDALEQKQRLSEQLAQLLKSQEQQLFAARLEHLQRQWQDLADFTAADSLEAEFNRLLKLAQEEAQRLAAEEAERQRQEHARQQAAELQEKLLEDLQQLAEEARNAAPDAMDTRSNREALQERWETSLQAHPASKAQKKNWQTALQFLQEVEAACERLSEHRPDLQLLLIEPDWSSQQLAAAQKLQQKIAWPASLAVSTELQQLEERLRQARPQAVKPREATQQLDSQAIEAELNELQSLLDAGKTRPAQKLLQKLQGQLDAVSEKQRQPFAPRLKKLAALTAELKDWQGFVAAPKRESLCEQMEQLAEDQSMEPQAKADRIQALQQEWRELGSAAASKELWQRFKQAADQAYEPCKAWFAEQAQQRQYNQQQRRIICEELEELSRGEQLLQLDEKALDQLLTKIHDEWHRFTPVNRADGKRLAERFQQALQPIKDQLHQLRQKNADAKRQLIEEARQLLEEDNLQAATQKSKQLQQDWRQQGRAPGSLEHQLWKEFRAACDQLFNKRDQERTHQQQARQEQFQAAQQQLESAQNHLQAGELEAANRLYQELKRITSVPREEKATWEENLAQFAGQLQERKQQQKNQALQEQLASRWEALPQDQAITDPELARKLAINMETLAGIPVPEVDQALKMQLQVERLNAGIKGEATASDRQEEAQELLKDWEEKIQSRQGQEAERFITALQSLLQ
ncbi:DUF349 domain-containing protein [Marinospirillum perlucidum]|uniref:DUF349 domain-containing protein n=1 Tax=Marinospirillum perlucidum TaxID=1982602 RepID=UPI000DF1E334|nr:DUF349 domain-containing protein [Marinospirillum perlucidum]